MREATIAAIASPSGPGLRGLIRLSGADAARLVLATTRLVGDFAPHRRGIHLGRFRDHRGEQPLLLLWMPAPRSYTREDVAELHLPGSPWLLEAALARLLELGAEPAQPGEFTRRAFENGRIDLLEAEGVLALVQAAGEAECRAASSLLLGGLGVRVAGLRAELEELRALCEASLDFDQSDTGHVPIEELGRLGQRVRAGLEEALSWEERREPLAGLPRIVLAGAPNAGKSTLFNALAADARALVSDLAGSTRDVLVGIWPIAGVDCRLVDTAGLDPEHSGLSDPDRQARARARAELEACDLILWLADPASGRSRSVALGIEALPKGPGCCLVWTKKDLGPVRPPFPHPGLPAVWVSAARREGLDELASLAATQLGLAGSSPALAEVSGGGGGDGRALSLRHRRALGIARDQLDGALGLLRSSAPLDLAAEALRLATAALDGIAGRTTPEDLLDRIFARFCLGK